MSDTNPAAKQRAAHIFPRAAHEWYVEEPAATQGLLTVEKFAGMVWDPCCGQGNIVKTLLAAGLDAVGTDIVRRVPDGTPWFLWEADFLAGEAQFPGGALNIVFNPPFSKGKAAEACIRRAISSMRGKVAAFVDQRFIGSARRANGLFADHPPTRIWSITPRVSCPPGEYLLAGNKAGGGTADYVWMVWDLTAPVGETRLGWIRNPTSTKFDREPVAA